MEWEGRGLMDRHAFCYAPIIFEDDEDLKNDQGSGTTSDIVVPF